uniref:NADH dehydrogenase subunit 6 n=1 Tax=Irochrotus sibiricus TaxID=2080396 RepID=A0A2P1CMM5_9HEMI|nr:NADH dehydrogenase subunit 6 [Irochrotus sibiricus]
MMMILYSMMVTLATLFLWMKHPLSMGFILVLQTVIITMASGLMLSNFFFSYIIMIIMLSGALVLFIYMASIASNEKFMTTLNMMMLSLFMFLTSLLVISNMNEMNEVPLNNNNLYSLITLIKLFNTLSAYMTITMILYLLLTMIITSFIASNSEGPLRMKTYEQTNT